MRLAAGSGLLPNTQPHGPTRFHAPKHSFLAPRHRSGRQQNLSVFASAQPPNLRRAESRSTEVAASSHSFSSADEPAVSREDGHRVDGSHNASLLASLDDVYHSAEEAVEATWNASPLGKAWAAYTRSLAKYPVRTKASTSFVGFVIGDILAQRIGGNTAINPFRCLRLGAYGLFIDGPLGHQWYRVLDRNVEPDNPNGIKAVLLKTAADQLLWAPIMTCAFFAVLKTLEGHPELILSTLQEKFWKTVIANYVLWPAAHFINFRFVPSEHRIMYNNCVSVAWNAYLSTLSHNAALDTTQLLGVLDQAQDMLNGWVPPELADTVSEALGQKGLEGMKFDIPTSIDLKPTRTVWDLLPLTSQEKGL